MTVSDGLHHNNIYDVLQDHLGFLWLASGNGLQKYDGYTFTFYHPNPSDSTFEEVLGLYEDQHQNLWIQRKSGLSRYRRERDDFIVYDFVDTENDTIPYRVISMAENLEGTLWAWIRNFGLYKVDVDANNFIPQPRVNEWFHKIQKQVTLKETGRKGIYETGITFQSGHHGRRLQYKYVIKRKNGAMEWEPNPNPANPENGNRELLLTGDSLNLPVVPFNSGMEIDQVILSQPGATQVRFSVDLNRLEPPLLEGDEIQIRGDVPPLRWQDTFGVFCIVFDSDNQLWIGTDNMGLFRLNPDTGEYECFVRNPGIPGAMSSNQIRAAIRDENGDLWFGSDYGLNRFDAEAGEFENYFADPSNKFAAINGAQRLSDDGQGNIWILSRHNNGGVSCFNKKSGKFTPYSPGFGRWFRSITLDRSGIVWLANEFRGVFKLNPEAQKFSAFTIMDAGKDALQGRVILSVYEDRTGLIWIGGYAGGLYRYDPQTGKSKIYPAHSASSRDQLASGITYIFQDTEGTFWIGTHRGLNRFDPKTGRFDPIIPEPYKAPGLARTSYIDEDAVGRLRVLTRNGKLVRYDPDSNEFFYVFGNSDRDIPIAFCDLVEDPRGWFWLAASDNMGLYKFDPVQKKLAKVETVGNVNISAIYLDADGMLWCGTAGQGLIRYDTQRDSKIILRENDGLLNTSIVGLEPDDSGNIWLCSQKGLSRFNPQSGVFKHYFKEDGFFNDEFSYQAHTRGNNGEFILGTMHGVVTFHPDSIKDSDYIPPVILTDFQINNKRTSIGEASPLKKHISVSNEITLAHDQNDLAITFAALDFSHPQRNRYAFFLENFEDDWRPPGLERTAYYTNLDPGEYVFRVKGTNSDGVWNEEGASIKITVLPPWWQSRFAYVTYGILFGLTLYGWRRFELRRAELTNELERKDFEAQKLKEVDEIKSRFFADISHEFRTPLTLILGPLQKFLSTTKDRGRRVDLSIMHRNAHRLRRLVDQLLDLSRIEAGRMPLRARPHDIVARMREWVASFVSLAESKKIAMNLRFPEQSIVVYFDAEKIEKIVYNLLSNAFKFTPEGGRITVGVGFKPTPSRTDFIEITFSDSGIGIPPEKIEHIFDRFYRASDALTGEQGGTGIGLALVKEFVELHHGEILVESEPDNGSTFTILLPLGREHLSDDEIVEHLPEDGASEPFSEIAEATINRPTPAQAETKATSNNGRPRVLTVEDNPDMRRYLRNCLAQHFDILEAENGRIGFDMACKKTPELIVSDVMMPQMDGFELCEKLKSDGRTSHIPVVLLTARAGQEDKLSGLEIGADDYLTKPFDAQELQARVKNLIDQRKKLRERFRREMSIRPKDITVTSIDEAFLQRALDIVEENIADNSFDVDQFAREIGMSRSTLNRKLRALTGLSTNGFIRNLRLKRASQLLAKKSATIVEIAYEVGFNNPSYFAECFRKQFGVSPSEYVSS